MIPQLYWEPAPFPRCTAARCVLRASSLPSRSSRSPQCGPRKRPKLSARPRFASFSSTTTLMKGFFKEANFYYLVFEFVTGGELFEEIVTRSYYNEQDASLCTLQILSALRACHARNIIHRDLKPENLLLADKTPEAPVKLTDFGLAVKMTDGPSYFGFAGTPGYLSPEVCRRVPYGPAVDVWATGVILYILLVGYPPFWHDDHQVLYEQIKLGDYDFPSPEWDTVTPEAKELIRRMLDLNPKTRITVEEALQHPWIARRQEVAAKIHRQTTLDQLKTFNAKRKLKGGIRAVMTTKRLTTLTSLAGKRSGEDKVESAVTALIAPPPGAAASTPGAKDVLIANQRLITAIVNKDWATYDQLTSDDLTCFEPEARGHLIQGMEFHKFYFDNLPENAGSVNTTILDPRARMLGNVAIVTYVRLTQFMNDKSPQTSRSEETRVWHLVGDKWVNVHFHRSGAPSAPTS
eukprot:m.186408 g.186408  ORF g.186408 m.186408 type:complete len:463 (-) comp10528_c0_seq1:202-1590(-)